MRVLCDFRRRCGVQVTNAVVLRAFPEYHRIHDEVHVHITHVPIVDKLRDLREVRRAFAWSAFFGVLREVHKNTCWYVRRMCTTGTERPEGDGVHGIEGQVPICCGTLDCGKYPFDPRPSPVVLPWQGRPPLPPCSTGAYLPQARELPRLPKQNRHCEELVCPPPPHLLVLPATSVCSPFQPSLKLSRLATLTFGRSIFTHSSRCTGS